MQSIDELARQLEGSEGDGQAQAAAAAEFLLSRQPEPLQEKLRAGLDAASVLRYFDAAMIGRLLELSGTEAKARFDLLVSMPFVESYRARGAEFQSIHEATRLGWRRRLAQASDGHFRDLSSRAAKMFADRSSGSRIQWIYHLLSGDPERGATELEKLDREWSASARPEDRYALATALKELDDSKLLRGRARVWALLVIEWTRAVRGERPRIAHVEREILQLARTEGDERAEGDALCLLGDALQAQGKLAEAQAAFERFLKLSRRLAEADPDNTSCQRELAVAWRRTGGALKAQGKLAEAQTAFAEDLMISRRLAELDPGKTGPQFELAVAWGWTGDVLQAQGKLEEAQAAFAEYLKIRRRLAELDPDNAAWQRGLAVAWNRTGGVLEAQGRLEEAQAAFAEYLRISRRLVELDPENADWERELAVACSRAGCVLEAQGKLEEAQAAFGESLQISCRLAELDPDNSGWQHDLGVAWNRTGGVLKAQGKLAEAQAAFAESLQISRRLAELDPHNAAWQRDLAARSQTGGVPEAQGRPGRRSFEANDEITGLLHRVQAGDHAAETRLLEVLYHELRRIAKSYLRSERKDHTLQPTALVHEAYLRLSGGHGRNWTNRTHFIAAAAREMRRVLVDSARARHARKRGGDVIRVQLHPDIPATKRWAEEILDIDAALERLAAIDERQARVVELRFFAGLTEVEIAEILHISERTVKREWEFARAWLYGELTHTREEQPPA